MLIYVSDFRTFTYQLYLAMKRVKRRVYGKLSLIMFQSTMCTDKPWAKHGITQLQELHNPPFFYGAFIIWSEKPDSQVCISIFNDFQFDTSEKK